MILTDLTHRCRNYTLYDLSTNDKSFSQSQQPVLLPDKRKWLDSGKNLRISKSLLGSCKEKEKTLNDQTIRKLSNKRLIYNIAASTGNMVLYFEIGGFSCFIDFFFSKINLYVSLVCSSRYQWGWGGTTPPSFFKINNFILLFF